MSMATLTCCKLNLRIYATFKVLSVSEEIPDDKIPMLMAGIGKILKTEKAGMVLNLLEVTQASPKVIKFIGSLKSVAKKYGAEILVVSTNEEYADVMSVEDAQAQLGELGALP